MTKGLLLVDVVANGVNRIPPPNFFPANTAALLGLKKKKTQISHD